MKCLFFYTFCLCRRLQRYLLDQRTTPLDTAIYWTEYVLRHNGAYHLQSPSRNYRYEYIRFFSLLEIQPKNQKHFVEFPSLMQLLTFRWHFFPLHTCFLAHKNIFFFSPCSFVQYYLLDVAAIFIALVVIISYIVRRILRFEGSSKVFNSLLKPVHIKQKIY